MLPFCHEGCMRDCGCTSSIPHQNDTRIRPSSMCDFSRYPTTAASESRNPGLHLFFSPRERGFCDLRRNTATTAKANDWQLSKPGLFPSLFGQTRYRLVAQDCNSETEIRHTAFVFSDASTPRILGSQRWTRAMHGFWRRYHSGK